MARRLLHALALLLVAGCAVRPGAVPAPAAGESPSLPEPATGWQATAGTTARRHLVSAANPLAAEAGLRILRAGGSALDASVAVQMVLGLVEPQSSGIGGGALLLHWDGQGGLQAWDGRETAPALADPRAFIGADGRALPLAQALRGGRAVATPGALRMLEAAHRQHGKLPWATLMEPAIELAESGFAVSPRLHALLQATPRLRDDALAQALYFQEDGTPLPVGRTLRNPAYAAVLRALAARGSEALHRGPVAADIVARVRGHAVPGRLSEVDLASYAPRLRQALCTDWTPRWRVCGFGPPASGHLAVMQILGLLQQRADLPAAPADGVPGADWLHLYTEAARLAFADRALYVADPDFTPPPAGRWDSLLDEAYLRQRAALIGPRRMPAASAGQPGGAGSGGTAAARLAPMESQPEQGTSHVSVVDGEGRAVALTSSIEAAFGARLMSDGGTGLAGGFLLNNQMTDFSALPEDAQGRPVANRIEPGKRPRSSMSPTLVFERPGGALAMVLGAPGGPAIIHFNARTLLATLGWGLDVQQAIALPNFAWFEGPVLLESGRFPETTVQGLRSRGHAVQALDLNSGLQAIQRQGSGWFGGADPRREGAVRGD